VFGIGRKHKPRTGASFSCIPNLGSTSGLLSFSNSPTLKPYMPLLLCIMHQLALDSYPDRSLKPTALTCLFTYKLPALARSERCIRALLDNTRWRNELALFDLGLDSPNSGDRSAEGGLEVNARLSSFAFYDNKSCNRANLRPTKTSVVFDAQVCFFMFFYVLF
jgi:hypothetical protein